MAKRLLDFGVHPPTIYFPLNVEEGMMIEPTETESKETLDYFIDTLISIAEEAKNDPDKVLEAPHTTVIDRLDEATAARKPILKFENLKQENKVLNTYSENYYSNFVWRFKDNGFKINWKRQFLFEQEK